ncbi:23S rRNA (adenine(1618)-N(6))-methyltransferase RlmF [Formosa sp. S-31]|uniref:23S rRNA (adenine(1618)-N(6))-methyltransferase RlmF n=1 Tax=Formosa sp. S-31 TaxID=2790949 RepID=UPI003EB828F4
MHPANKHNKPYNFKALIKQHPALAPYVFISPLSGQDTIDFSINDAVIQLNKAILKTDYGLKEWNIPHGYLCPPIPGRADYIHHLNDLVQVDSNQQIKGLDIGIGANAIYPILATQTYGWHMVGCDINAKAVKSARENIAYTPELTNRISIRQQTSNADIFKGIIKLEEYFHFTMCNPPFFTSEADADKATKTKLKQLKISGNTAQNFGGQANELWCNGGEALFIKRMIKQSVGFKTQVGWFTTLVAHKIHLAKLLKQLEKLKATYKVIEMEHGNKKSRILAWKF